MDHTLDRFFVLRELIDYIMSSDFSSSSESSSSSGGDTSSFSMEEDVSDEEEVENLCAAGLVVGNTVPKCLDFIFNSVNNYTDQQVLIAFYIV